MNTIATKLGFPRYILWSFYCYTKIYEDDQIFISQILYDGLRYDPYYRSASGTSNQNVWRITEVELSMKLCIYILIKANGMENDILQIQSRMKQHWISKKDSYS